MGAKTEAFVSVLAFLTFSRRSFEAGSFISYLEFSICCWLYQFDYFFHKLKDISWGLGCCFTVHQSKVRPPKSYDIARGERNPI